MNDVERDELRKRLKDYLAALRQEKGLAWKESLVLGLLGGVGLMGLVIGWYYWTWYAGLGLMLALGLPLQFAIEPFHDEWKKEVKVLLRQFFEKEIAAGDDETLAAIVFWSHNAEIESEFADSLSRAVIEIRDAHPELSIETSKKPSKEKKLSLPVPPQTSAAAETLPAKGRPSDGPVSAVSASGQVRWRSYKGYDTTRHGESFVRLHLDKDDPDIIFPPHDVGDLRYIVPESNQWFDSQDIGSGMAMAVTKRHFVFSILGDRCWRVGHDCITSYEYRENEQRKFALRFLICLDHSLNFGTCRTTAGFSFGITWNDWTEDPKFFVPILKQAFADIGGSCCPVCGKARLKVKSKDVMLGLFSTATIPSQKALCQGCGAGLKYVTLVGAWMPLDDAAEPSVSIPDDELLLRATEMGRVLACVESELMGKQSDVVEIVRKHTNNFNLGMGINHLFTTRKQRRFEINRARAGMARLAAEYVDGVKAYKFNFNTPVNALVVRLYEHLRQVDPSLTDGSPLPDDSKDPGVREIVKKLRRALSVSMEIQLRLQMAGM